MLKPDSADSHPPEEAARDRRLAVLVVLIAALLTAGSLYLAVNKLAVNTDPMDLLSPSLPVRQAQSRFESAFPATAAPLLLVVEADAPEYADAAADSLAASLRDAESVRSVDRPGSGTYLKQQGLLFRSESQLRSLTKRFIQAMPLIVSLRNDPSLINLSANIERVLPFLARDPSPTASGVLNRIAATMEKHAHGEPGALSWQTLLADPGDPGGPGDTEGPDTEVARAIVTVVADLDYARFEAAGTALEAVRREIERIEAQDHYRGVDVRVTGAAALAAEEKQTLMESMQIIGPLSLGLVSLVLLLALRAAPVLIGTVSALIVGLILTAGFAALAVGRLNLISIAFAVLYVGLGADFAIHFALRYRTELRKCGNCHDAITKTERRTWSTLAICAVSTAMGFLAFVPTAYVGVSELGIIAGGGMVISLVVTMTLIPAVLTLMPKPRRVPRGRPLPKPVLAVLRLPVKHRWSVLGVAAAIAVASAFLVPSLRFNPDPLDLRDPKSEAVLALRDLSGDRSLGRYTITALVDGREQVSELKDRLRDVESIEKVISLESFVPDNQEAKLDLVAQLRGAISAAIGSGQRLGDVASPAEATVEQRLDALRSLRSSLERVELPEAQRLRDAVGTVVAQAGAMPQQDAAVYLDDVRERLLGTLPLALGRLEFALSPRAVSLETLPEDLVSHWVGGEVWRVEVQPSERYETVSDMRPAVDVVQQAAGATYVTGGPVLQMASADAIVQAFRRAVLLAVIGISLVLLLRLRSLTLTALVLVPLALGGVATGAFMVLVDMPLNFANVIALPLLLGVGVDNGIHMVHRREHGMPAHGNLLETTTARAVLFSALTTLCSFGNLAISSHPGMASMGIVLTVGVVLMLGCTLILLPAFFGIGHRR